MPIQTSPLRAVPCLPCRSKLRHTAPHQDTPRLPCHTGPCDTFPRLACHAKPRVAAPCRIVPSPACLAPPNRAEPRLAMPSLPCQAVQSPAQMRRAMPSLLWRSAYWILNLALTATSRLLSTTWNRPNPHPALALLSGLPAPIPTCKPQRLTRLITSTILN